MRQLFYKIFPNFFAVFTGWNLLWQALAISITYILIISGADFHYELFWHRPTWQIWLFPAALLGFFVPVFLPLYLIISGWVKKQAAVKAAGFAAGQAALLGYFVSIFYKFFTGRPGPEGLFGSQIGADTSRLFRFGFYRGGIFFGWPSSHTCVSVALAVALFVLLRRQRYLKYLPLIYSTYIAFGVSTTIHWLSDVVAGIIFGSLVGLAVGKSFAEQLENDPAGRQG